MNKKRILLLSFFTALILIPTLALAAGGAFTYTPMEQIPGFTTTGNFYNYIGIVYKFGLWTVGICAMFMIGIGGYMYIMSAGNSSSMTKAKGVIFDAIAGLILALVSYLILFEINPNLVRLDGGTAGGGASTTSQSAPVTTPSGSCANAATDMAHICTASCQKTCNNLGQYDSIINKYVTSTITAGMIKSIMCHESTGDPNAINTQKGACGLMQVMPNGSCTADSKWGNLLDPETNIRAGIATLTKKMNAVAGAGYNYSGGITPFQMATAAYNCCSDGTSPNTPSRDCGSTVPKWACPTNPGTGTFNMCTVKDYVCDVSACAS